MRASTPGKKTKRDLNYEKAKKATWYAFLVASQSSNECEVHLPRESSTAGTSPPCLSGRNTKVSKKRTVKDENVQSR